MVKDQYDTSKFPRVFRHKTVVMHQLGKGRSEVGDSRGRQTPLRRPESGGLERDSSRICLRVPQLPILSPTDT